MRHGSLTCGKAVAFVSTWSIFRCTRSSPPLIIMTDWSPHIYQSLLPSTKSQRYQVPVSGYSWHNGSGCWPMAKLWCTGEFCAYHCDRSIAACSPIWYGNTNKLGYVEYLGQNTSHAVTHLWQSRSFCYQIIEILPHGWFTFQGVGIGDMARVVLA